MALAHVNEAEEVRDPWPQQRERKQSAGVGFKANRCQLAVAFPFQTGHPDPVFYAGMNF